jgi:hypothetical protein
VTTIAYRDGVLASDGRTSDGSYYLPSAKRKAFKSDSGWLYGACGKVSAIVVFQDWAASLAPAPRKKPVPPKGDYDAILVSPRGVVFYVEDGSMWEAESEFAATGSGFGPALGAMHVGASAVEAVEAACKVDPGSGNGVFFVTLKD